MIDIYAIYTRISTGTVKIQSIPAGSQDQIYLLNPTVKCEMGNAESMDFSVQAGTKYYDAFIQMRSFIQVVYEDTTIFYGRVLTIDNGAFGSRKIHCEGALTFLNDSQFPGKPEKSRDSQTILEHMTDVISNHNIQLSDSLRTFTLGEVPGHYSNSVSSEQRIANESREFGSSSWAESKSLLEDLKSHYGGHFRTRYYNGIIYLDWMNHYFRSTVNLQTIEVGKNLIDISGTTEVNNIFTAIIPIGKTENTKEGDDDKVYISYHGRNYITIPEVTNFYSDAQLNSGYHRADDYRNAINNYGMIFKTVEIQEGSTPGELLQKAAQWIKENYQGGIENFSVKAVDLRQIGENTQKILTGDRVKIVYTTGTTGTSGRRVETTLTCTAITYDLFNPENNQYSFGIPANALSKNYGVKSTKSAKQKSTAAPARIPSGGDPAPVDENERWRQAVFAELKKHKTWFKSTGRQETGPEDRASMPNKQKIWHAHETMTDGKSNFEVWIPRAPHWIESQSVYVQRVRGWDRDGQGRPLGSWAIGPESQFTISYLRAHYLFEYMVDEHEVDLTSDLSVKMPATYTDEDGTLTLTTATPVLDPETGEPVRTTMAVTGEFNPETGIFNLSSPIEFGASDPETGIYNFLTDDGKGFLSQNIDGNWHYYQPDSTHPGQFIEVTNVRDLHLREEKSENFIGTIVTAGYTDGDGNVNTYKFGQEIIKNAYEAGDIVVAHVDGDMVMLGSNNTKWNYSVASRVNNVWVEPYYWTTDSDGVRRKIMVDKAGAFNYRGYFDIEPTSPTYHEFVPLASGNQGPHGEPIISFAADGIWDDKNLALRGGIITGQVGGQYVSYIKSDRLVIGSRSDLTVTNALKESGVIDSDTLDPNALVAQTVYTQNLNAVYARIRTIEADYVQAIEVDADYINSKFVGTAVFRAGAIETGSFTYTYGTQSGTESVTFGNGIKKLKIFQSGNNYTLKYLKNSAPESDSNYLEIENATFSRAVASWNKGWSNGVWTVTASPQNQSQKLGFGKAYGTNDSDLEVILGGTVEQATDSQGAYIASTIKCPITVQELKGSGAQPLEVYSKDILAFAGGVLETRNSETVGTVAKTFTPTTGKIGISSIKVTPTHSIPTGTAIDAQTFKTTGISITADEKTATASLVLTTTRPSTQDVNCINLTLDNTIIGRYEISNSTILETRSVSVAASAKTFTPSSGKLGISSITVTPTHTAPAGTAISGNVTKATGIDITADGKTSTARLDKETFRPSGTSSDVRGVKLTLGTTVIGRIDTNSYYTDGVTAGQTSVRNNINDFGSVYSNGDIYASTYGWEGISHIKVDVSSVNPYPTTKTLYCTGATFRSSEWIYTFSFTSSSSGLFTSGSSYKFHHNSGYT